MSIEDMWTMADTIIVVAALIIGFGAVIYEEIRKHI